MKSLVFGWLGVLTIVSGKAAPAAAGIAADVAATFSSQPADVLASIARGCFEERQALTERDAVSVTCEAPLGRPERVATRVLLRAPFQPLPRAFIRCQATSDAAKGSVVRVIGWVQDAPTGSARRPASLAGRRFDRRFETFLARLGGHAAPT